MGSHYYEPNLDVEQQLEHYRARVVRYRKQYEKTNLPLKLQMHYLHTHNIAEACVNYLLACKQNGIKYISVADLPLHRG